MSDIPPEVITDILSHLPVKSLLRFRCVSKSFKSLIDGPKFIQIHFNRHQEPNLNLILKTNKKADNLFSLEFSSNTSAQQHPKELDHPLKELDPPTQVLGSCRGLVLISNCMRDNGVWNPSTKRFRRLPFCEFHPPGRLPHGQSPGLALITGGFGYDDNGEDYKVVTIAQWYHPDDEPKLVSETMIYSLKFGGWKKMQDCPYFLLKEKNGTFAGGELYWIVMKEPCSSFGPFFLVGLNLGSERFEKVELPENLRKADAVFVIQFHLAALDECLCLIASYVTHTNGKNQVLDHVDVWMMKDGGVKQSWVKMFSVEQLEGRQHFSYLRPIAYSVTRKEVLLEMDHRKFLWYSLEKKSLKHAKVSGGLDAFESFVNLGTLMPLYGGNDEKDGKKGMEEQDILDSVIEGMKEEL